ncbi:Uncharacterized protein FWK35_00028369, partial [Aphis craccivora]
SNIQNQHFFSPSVKNLSSASASVNVLWSHARTCTSHLIYRSKYSKPIYGRKIAAALTKIKVLLYSSHRESTIPSRIIVVRFEKCKDFVLVNNIDYIQNNPKYKKYAPTDASRLVDQSKHL